MADIEFVWYKHPKLCWSNGRVVKSNGLSITVQDVSTGENAAVNRADTHPYDPSHSLNLDDIAHMNNMHEGVERCEGVMCSVFRTGLPTRGSRDGQFASPRSMATAGQHLYVLDQLPRVQVFE